MVRNEEELPYKDVSQTQINAKRHWRKRVKRIIRMVRAAQAAGSTIITLNEVDKAMVMAIKALPGWDIYWTVNDELRNGNFAGNAVAWRVESWEVGRTWESPVTIRYRKGLKYRGGKGRWARKTIKQACVRLKSVEDRHFAVAVMAYHYPTKFNSDEESRQNCVEDTEEFLQLRVENDVPAIASGDGNGARPKVDGVRKMAKDGPDETFSNGRRILSRTLHTFKIMGWSDHAGLHSVIRFLM